MFFEDRSIHTRSGEVAAVNPGAKARITRSGDRLTIIAAGRTAALAEDAADQLAEEGNRGAIEVVSLGFIKPMDQRDHSENGTQDGKSTDRARRTALVGLRALCALFAR